MFGVDCEDLLRVQEDDDLPRPRRLRVLHKIYFSFFAVFFCATSPVPMCLERIFFPGLYNLEDKAKKQLEGPRTGYVRVCRLI